MTRYLSNNVTPNWIVHVWYSRQEGANVSYQIVSIHVSIIIVH